MGTLAGLPSLPAQDPSPRQPQPSPRRPQKAAPARPAAGHPGQCHYSPSHFTKTTRVRRILEHHRPVFTSAAVVPQSPPGSHCPKTFWPPATSAPALQSGGYLHRVPLDHLDQSDLRSSHSARHPLSGAYWCHPFRTCFDSSCPARRPLT